MLDIVRKYSENIQKLLEIVKKYKILLENIQKLLENVRKYSEIVRKC